MVTAYEYCPKDLVTKQAVDPAGLNLVTTYDVCAMKRITKMEDPKGKVTYYQYDGLYRRTKVTDDYGVSGELNISTSYYYDKGSLPPGGNSKHETLNSKLKMNFLFIV